MGLREIVIEEQSLLETLRKEQEDIILNSPEGTFFTAKNGKYNKWYIYRNGKKVLIKKRDIKLARQMAAKLLASVRLREIEDEQAAIDAHLEKRGDSDSKVFLQQHEAIRQLLSKKPLLSDRVKKWMNESYPKNNKPYKGTLYKTLKGDLVKSKAEQEIADALFLAGIPYRYEPALSFDNGATIIYPDFVIMNPFSGNIFIWEHFGMEELKRYRHKNADKMYIYFDNGFIPGFNLITTVSNDEIRLTPAKIQKTIQYYFSESDPAEQKML